MELVNVRLQGLLLVVGSLVWGRLAGRRLGSVGSREQLGSCGPVVGELVVWVLVVGELVVGVAARALVLLGSWSCERSQAAISSKVELAGQGGGFQQLSVEE